MILYIKSKLCMISLSLLMLCIGVSTAYSQDETDEDLYDLSLEELMEMQVSVGSKTVRNIDQAPGAITIITKEQIRQTNARSLRDILNMFVPGMDVTPAYFNSGVMVNESIYARGTLSDFNQQILILFNGENKFNESTFGSPYPGMEFTLENVERIEINSSPSPLLGGSALTTINVVTKEQYTEGVETMLNIGLNNDDGFQSKRLTVNLGKTINSWHVGSSLQFYNDKGQVFTQSPDSILNVTGALRDGTPNAGNFTINIKSPNDILEIGSWYKVVKRDAFLSNLSLSQSADLYYFQSQVFHNYAKVKITKGLDASVGYSTYGFDNTFNLNEPIPVGVNQRINVPSRNEIKNYNIYAQLNYLKEFSLAGNHILLAGGKIEREGQSEHKTSQLNDRNEFVDVTLQRKDDFGIDLPDGDRSIYAVFAEDNWEITKQISLLAGFRFDSYKNFNDKNISAFNPRIALSYIPHKKFIIKALYATAVRPPSNYELTGNNFLPLLYGNNSLTFEELSTYELNFIYKGTKLRVSFNPYSAQFKNKIRYEASPIDTTISVASNSGNVEVFGVESSVQYTLSENNYLFINTTVFTSKNTLSNTKTFFVPDRYLSGGFNGNWKKVNVNVNAYYRGKRELPNQLVQNKQKAAAEHIVTNLSLRYSISKSLEFYCLAENLFDKENFIPLSRDGLFVPLRGRTFNIGYRFSF
ncbi:MAG: TonB-dependent receptor [Cytophagia bacterium]|nr:TonB-dependent receptor [Cytophagia bacterium]